MKRTSILLGMLGTLLLTGITSTSLAQLPFLTEITLISMGLVIMLLLSKGILQKKQESLACSLLFFSVMLLNTLFLYILSKQELLFFTTMFLSILGILFTLYNMKNDTPLSIPEKKELKKEDKKEKTEETIYPLQIVDLPILKSEETPLEKPLQPLARTYVVTMPKEEKKIRQAKKKTRRKTQKKKIRRTKKKVKKIRYPQYGLTKIEGIAKIQAGKLRKTKVRNTAQLLKKGATPQGRKDLAKKSRISPKLILKWVNMCDLLRVKGIGEEYSELLERAGVDTVPEIKQRNAEKL